MEITARQIGRSYRLPLHAQYRGYRDRFHVSGSFARGIIAKYRAGEGPELPSVDFVYPDSGSSAQELLDLLANRMITLNRIRVQLNIHPYRFLQNYAIALDNSCRIILGQMRILSPFAHAELPEAAVRELDEIYREISLNRADDGGEERGGRTADDEEFILRVLTASSRGNGTRERYMSILRSRLRENVENRTLFARELLRHARYELFRTREGRNNMTVWASEQARQFFWRIQRAPEQERQFFLQAGGFSSLVSLEKALRTMDDVTFRRFSARLIGRLEEYTELSGRIAARDVTEEEIVRRMPAEEWDSFAGELERGGFVFRGGAPSPEGPERMPAPGEPGEPSEGDEVRIREEKRMLLEALREDYASSARLRNIIRETAEKTEILREGQDIYRTLAESILNLPVERWNVLSREMRELRGESEELRMLLPERELLAAPEKEIVLRRLHEISLLPEDKLRGMAELLTSRTILGEYLPGLTPERIREEREVRQTLEETIRTLPPERWIVLRREMENLRTESEEVRRILPEREILMSSEKRILLRRLYELSLLPEPAIRDVERVIASRTLLKEHLPERREQPEFRNLSAREREGWLKFIRDLFESSGSDTERTANIVLAAGGARFMSGLLERTLREGGDRREMAVLAMEHLRETRILQTERERETGIAEYPAAPDMELPQPGRGRAAALEAAARMAGAEETRRGEITHDIEFETTVRQVTETTRRETVSELREVLERLDRQQREIERIRKEQERAGSRDVSRELLERLDGRLRMERLRGGF